MRLRKVGVCSVYVYCPLQARGDRVSIDHIIEVLHHGADRMLGVVDAEIAVLMPGEESAQECRAVPIRKMLRGRIRVLERGQELQAALQRFTKTIVVDHIAGLASDAAGLG